MQQEMLDVMGKASTIEEIKSLLAEIIDVVKKYVDQLKAGNVNPYDLVVKRHISKDPFEYSNRSINAIVSQTLAESGVSLSPGESIQYIITDASGKKDARKAVPLALYALDDGYDISKYCDMVVDAAMTMLLGLGVNEEQLKEYLELLTPAEKRTLRKKRMPVQSELKFK
jgi:DNA polymerase elongation subunit (family B)